MAAASNGFMGTILSGGPGANYSASIVGVGTKPVVCQQIDADETIPAGTKILVILEGGVYKFVAQVWLDDA